MKKIFIIISLIVFESFAGFSELPLDINTIDFEGYHHHYNKLSSVEEAYEEVSHKKNFQDFLRNSKELFLRYDMINDFGIRLLHKHHHVLPGQVVNETFENIEGENFLISKPKKLSDEEKKETFPHGWMFDGENVKVFEVGQDPYFKKALTFTSRDKLELFFSDFNVLLESYDLKKNLGVSILSRETLPVVPGTTSYLEETLELESRLRLVPVGSYNSDEVIRTTWSFNPITFDCYKVFVCNSDASGKHQRILSHNFTF